MISGKKHLILVRNDDTLMVVREYIENEDYIEKEINELL
jgi:hypothetical protein